MDGAGGFPGFPGMPGGAGGMPGMSKLDSRKKSLQIVLYCSKTASLLSCHLTCSPSPLFLCYRHGDDASHDERK